MKTIKLDSDTFAKKIDLLQLLHDSLQAINDQLHKSIQSCDENELVAAINLAPEIFLTVQETQLLIYKTSSVKLKTSTQTMY